MSSKFFGYTSFDDLVHIRYGILDLPYGFKIPAELTQTYEFLGRKNKLLFLLGHIKEILSPAVFEKTRVYFSLLLHHSENSGSLSYPLSSLADTLGDPAQFPYQAANCMLKVEPVQEPNGDFSSWYLISSKKPIAFDVNYTIAISDPLAVNELIREHCGTSAYDLSRSLLRKGVPFKTLVPYLLPPQLMFPAPLMPMFREDIPLGLGIRRAGDSNFTLKDYEDYIQRCREFVWSPPGRAALLAGGILRRLAISALGDNLDELRILSGPSPYLTRQNYIAFNGSGYVDDVITEHQADILAGVYRVIGTGK